MQDDSLIRSGGEAQAPAPPSLAPNPAGPPSIGKRLAAGRAAARAARKHAKTQCIPPASASGDLGPQVGRILADCPPKARKRYLNAVAGKGGIRQAVKSMCHHCCGWERVESAQCTARGCPLWAFNPWRKAAERRLSGREREA